MKLRRLRIQNLASLEGEHEIDFTGPLGESPIFLVMGPTGAGKSTLLDAICLALFGVTPRLSKERGDGLETDPRLIMTRGTFECRAFLEFSKIEASGERRIYQAEWYCHRANKKPDGNLQPPRRSMGLVGPNGDVDPLLPSQRGADMAPVFRQVLEGVTVEDFKRSVLLAQGEFAAFLKADDGERGKILERLIHAEPFRALGKRVSQRRSEQDKLVQEWKGKVGATQLPTEGEQAQLHADEALAREAQEAAQKALALGEELGRRAAYAEHLARQLQESEAQVPVLEQSLAAANTLRAEALAQQQTRFTAAADLRERREALVPLVQQARQARLQEAKAKALFDEAQTAFTQAEQDRVRKARLRDEAHEKAAQVATRAAQCEATRARLTPYQGLVERLPAFEATTNHLRHFVKNAGLEKNDIAEAEGLRETPNDERTFARDRARQEHEEALAGAPDARSRRQDLLAQRNGLQPLLTELPLLAQALEQGAVADKAVLESKATLETAERAHQNAEKLSETQTALARTLGEALRGVGDELKNLQWMMSLAEGRQHLHKEHPCPLCGSREHPALHEEGRQRLDDELLARKALLETRQKELTQQHTEAESQLRQCKAEEAAQKARWQTLHDHHRAAEAQAEGVRAHVRRLAAPLHLPDGISFREIQDRLSQAKASDAQLQADLDRLEKTEALARRLERQEAALRYLAERAQLLVDLGQAGAPLEGPDTKSRVDGALQFAHAQREALQKATEALAQAQRDGAECAARQTGAETALQEASAAYERESLRHQQAKSLVDEARAQAAPLLGGRDPDTVEEEQRRAEHLANEQLQTATNALGQASQKVTALEARLEEIRQKASTLRQEVAHALQSMQPAREAGLVDANGRWDPARLEERRQAYAEATRVWGALGEKVAALDAAKSKAVAFQKELAAAQEALDLWKRLHDLVGTKDGEDFKNFALSLELQCLLEQANHRLARLAPRYRLEQATDKDGNPRLAFAIADAFQADQERPLSTLSGGETFLVSLALALALADYRALRMPMETLLIDEGFGTLDPDTLNVAMGALEALHASGVQVGVISHVEALKERIFARIAVRPDRPGRSRIHTELVGT